MRRCPTILAAVALALAATAAFSAARAAEEAAAVSDQAFDAALEKSAAAKVGEAEFREALRSVAPRFPLVEPSTEAGAGAWTKLSLNARGKRVDAIRVRTPDGDPRDLVWAFATAKSVDRWYILAVDGEMKQGFRNFWKVKPAELFGPEASTLPAGAELTIVQTLEAKHLKAGQEYLIWFAFKDDKPADAWVALSFLPPGKSGNANAASKNLGLPRPPATEAATSDR